jgi:hypothetical protein
VRPATAPREVHHRVPRCVLRLRDRADACADHAIEKHRHGAGPERFTTHIAMQEAHDSGSPVAWGEHVTD